MKPHRLTCARCSKRFTSAKTDKEFCTACVKLNATDRWRKRHPEVVKEGKRAEWVGALIPCKWCQFKIYRKVPASEITDGVHTGRTTGNVYCCQDCEDRYKREKQRIYIRNMREKKRGIIR